MTWTRGLAAALTAALLASPVTAAAEARKVDDSHWEGVERIVVIGDLHGDYAQYTKVLELAGLVNRRGKWVGGDTHLVQTGDVPDRGPDTRRILDHLRELKAQAEDDGGYVHTLIGNHEAMNVYGDLRYVTPAEFEAFEGRNSKRYQDLQWEHHLKTLQARDPAAFEELDLEVFRKEWEAQYPLGWVEHRQAWAPQGEYGEYVLDNPAVLKVNDTLFVHGGLSAKYCQDTLADINGRVHEGLEHFDYEDPGIIEDPLGPLWYRGLATDSEAQRGAMVDAILERYGATRIVVGHTPTQGVVWPRFDGKVVLNDTGIAAYYGGHAAFLELGPDGAVAHYPGGSLPLPAMNDERIDYLKQVVALAPSNAHLRSRLERMRMAAARGGDAAGEPSGSAAESAEAAVETADAAAAVDTVDTEAPDPEAAQREAWLSPDNCR